jgi:hypothetical protein
MGNGQWRMGDGQSGASVNLPPEEELLIKNPFTKKNFNFTLRCQLVKYRPEMARRLKLFEYCFVAQLPGGR